MLPMKVVSLNCSNTEIVCALGAADMLVGVDDHSDFPPAVVDALPRVGPDLDPDMARIKALNPDARIADGPRPRKSAAKPRRCGIRVSRT